MSILQPFNQNQNTTFQDTPRKEPGSPLLLKDQLSTSTMSSPLTNSQMGSETSEPDFEINSCCQSYNNACYCLHGQYCEETHIIKESKDGKLLHMLHNYPEMLIGNRRINSFLF